MPATEFIVLFLVIIAVILVYYFLKIAKHLIVNTVLGLIILLLTHFVLDIGIEITVPVLLIFAIGGIPGAALVIILHLLGVAF